jgi:hypothetical protein
MVLLPGGDAIHRWASLRRAEGELPLLVRRLIAATTEPTWISIPAETSVRFPGWDGEVEVPVGNTWVASGTSYWEMGTSGDVDRKANEDFRKRTLETGEEQRFGATFVFVTPKRWQRRQTWIAERVAENQWKDVRAIDAEGLATWLEGVPYVHLWFSHLVDGRVHGAVPLELWWRKWSERSDPHPLTPSTLLRGRTAEARLILEWMSAEPRRRSIRGVTADDVVAFVGATFSDVDPDLNPLLTRSVVVRDSDAWDELILREPPMILLPTFEEPWIKRAVDNGHHVLVPVAAGDPATAEAELRPLTTEDLLAGLEELGLDPRDARSIVDETGEDLTAVRRRLSGIEEFRSPPWSCADVGPSLVPVVLADTWDESIEGDREALARLARRPYEALAADLADLASGDDAPVRRRGSVWLLTDRDDAWRQLAAWMTRADLAAFERLTVEVLGEPDSSLELAPDRRWMAGVYGKGRVHSARLREGLAGSVAILAGWRRLQQLPDDLNGPAIADRITDELFRGISSDASGQRWMALSDELPALAEAAPERFLAVVAEGLDGSEPILLRLMADSEAGGTFGRAVHAGTLWGLEAIAWSPAYLPRVAALLTRWSALDRGERRWANRPNASFRAIFLPWNPQTSATTEQRIEALATARESDRDAAWQLLVSLMPKPLDYTAATHQPMWRPWAPQRTSSRVPDDRAVVERQTMDWLIEDVGTDATRWSDLIDISEYLPADREDQVISVLDRLAALDLAALTEADHEALWVRARERLARHRDESGQPTNHRVAAMQRAVEHLEPGLSVSKARWLFRRVPDMVLVLEGDDGGRFGELLTERRDAAFRAVLAGGWGDVEMLVDTVEDPFAVGFTIGRVADVADGLVIPWATAGERRLDAWRGFVASRTSADGWPWLRGIVAEGAERWPVDVTVATLPRRVAHAKHGTSPRTSAETSKLNTGWLTKGFRGFRRHGSPPRSTSSSTSRGMRSIALHRRRTRRCRRSSAHLSTTRCSEPRMSHLARTVNRRCSLTSCLGCWIDLQKRAWMTIRSRRWSGSTFDSSRTTTVASNA